MDEQKILRERKALEFMNDSANKKMIQLYYNGHTYKRACANCLESNLEILEYPLVNKIGTFLFACKTCKRQVNEFVAVEL